MEVGCKAITATSSEVEVIAWLVDVALAAMTAHSVRHMMVVETLIKITAEVVAHCCSNMDSFEVATIRILVVILAASYTVVANQGC